MNKTFLQKSGVAVMQGLIALSVFVPAVALAQTGEPDIVITATKPKAESTQAAVTPVAATNATVAPTSGPEDNFTPLTQVPGLVSISKADSFSLFINTFYKICIGLGAVLAVIMIMYGGILIMTSSGSVSSNEKAKDYIKNAVLGLVLVLTPTIVFGIINPDILNIDIGREFSDLATKLQQAEIGNVTNQVDVTAVTLGACSITADTQQKACMDNSFETAKGLYNDCVLKKDGTDCAASVKTATPSLSKKCIANLTDTQTSCLSTQWGSAMTSGITKKTNSCSTYDSFKPISDPDGNAACGVGYEKIINPGQCTPQTNNGAGCVIDTRGVSCCGHVPQKLYLLAYHFDRTPTQGGKSCVSYYAGEYYATQEECTTQMNRVKTDPVLIQTADTKGSNLTFDKACAVVTTRDYKVPADANACKI